MSALLPLDWLDPVITATKGAGRDFSASPLTQREIDELVTLRRAGYSPAQAAEYLTRGRITVARFGGDAVVERGPWGDPDERSGDAA